MSRQKCPTSWAAQTHWPACKPLSIISTVERPDGTRVRHGLEVNLDEETGVIRAHVNWRLGEIVSMTRDLEQMLDSIKLPRIENWGHYDDWFAVNVKTAYQELKV